MDRDELMKQGKEIAGKLRDGAGEQVAQHEQQIRSTLDKVVNFVNEKTDGKYSSQVAKAAGFFEQQVDGLASEHRPADTERESGPGTPAPGAASPDATSTSPGSAATPAPDTAPSETAPSDTPAGGTTPSAAGSGAKAEPGGDHQAGSDHEAGTQTGQPRTDPPTGGATTGSGGLG